MKSDSEEFRKETKIGNQETDKKNGYFTIIFKFSYKKVVYE